MIKIRKNVWLAAVVVLVLSFGAPIFCSVNPPQIAGSGSPDFSGDQVTFNGIPFENLQQEMQILASNEGNILFRTAIFDPLVAGEPSFADLGFSRQEPGEWDYFLIQFNVQPDEKVLNKIAGDGVYLLRYIPNNTFIAAMETKAIENLYLNYKGIRWIGLYQGGYKVDPKLLRGTLGGSIVLNVTLFPGEDPFAIYSSMRQLSKDVRFISVVNSDTDTTMRIYADGETMTQFVQQASTIRGIETIDYWSLPHIMNDNSVWVVQNYDTVNRTTYNISATIWNHAITGTGQLVGVSDTGCDTDMCYFRLSSAAGAITDSQSPTLPGTGTIDLAKKVAAYYVLPSATAYDGNTSCNGNPESWHGTHVCGSVLGDNYATLSTPTSGGHDAGDGMAPNAKLIFQDAGSETTGCLDGLANDNYLIFQQAYNAGARLHSNSWGGDTAGAYTSDCKTVDKFIYRNQDFLIFFANGNAGSGAMTVGSPAAAKNCISIGALTNGSSDANAMASFSSRGPTADGRIKPDVSAPGSSIVSAQGTTSHTDNNCSTTTMDGTSMATPTAAGTGALLRQYFYDGFYPTGAATAANAMTPSAALMKAALINGAMDIATADIPNNNEGFGRVQLDNVLFFSTPTRDARKTRAWDKRNVVGLATGQTDEYQVSVTAGQAFKVTLVWTDPEASTAAGVALVNNLNLEVVSPSAQTYRGNCFASGQSTTTGTADALNNVETFLLTTPTAGTWTIRVVGASVPGTPLESYSNRQGYALVATFGDCTNSLAAPASMTATNNGTTGINLSWGSVSGAAEYYIYRADGNCTLSAEKFSFMGKTSSTSYTDTLVQGGYTYAYKVRAADTCGEGAVSSCATATYSGNCALYPTFAGLVSAVNNLSTTTCDIDLTWSAGSSNCPLGNSIKYNVYRGTNPYFAVGGSSRIAVGLTSTTYTDSSVVPNTTYFYVVRAEDGTTLNGGPANGGNEDLNTVIKSATPYSSTYTYGTWSDNGGDTNAKLFLTGEWTITNTLNHTTGGTYCYHNAPDGSTHSPMQCTSATTPPLALQSGQAPSLSYWVNYNLEIEFDGVVVEISTNGGSTWTAITPTLPVGYPSTFAQTTATPINACGYAASQGCFNGPTGNAALTGWTMYTHNLTSYAGQTVLVRWNFSSDPGSEFQGFYLDDIQVTFAGVNNECAISDGVIVLDKDIYNCGETVSISVIDSDLTGAGTKSVTINSTTEASPQETVVLTESPASSGRFIGTISTVATPPGYNNGTLSVVNGDTITATYIDANDGHGGTDVTKTDTATTDCQGPVISNVMITNITATSARVTWTTNEAANSRVTYGTSTPPGTNMDDLTNYVTSHTMDLSGLSTCTQYYVSVTSADVPGNSTTDTNGGAYYSFTTQGMSYAFGPATFESGTTGWTLTGTPATDWRRDTCKAHGGTYAMKAGSATCPGTQTISTTSDLTWGSDINLGATGHGYHLRFWEWYNTESGYDDCRPQISTDGGTNWTNLAEYNGSSGGWIQKDYDLAAYSGNIRIRFEAYADSLYSYEGWYVDDVEVSKSQGCSAELIRQSHTMTEACNGTGSGGGNTILEPGEDATIVMTMINNGMTNATGVSATLSCSTPGVTVTTNTATFPTINAGATGVSLSPHFTVHVDASVTCVTTANFTLHSTSTQNPTGTDSYFSINVGQAGGAVTVFSETFSGVTVPGLPAGWTISSTSGNNWVSNATGCTNNALMYPYNSTAAANSYAYTPSIALTSGVTYTLGFNQKVYSATYPETFEVKCGTAATPAGQTITIRSSASYTNTACQALSNTFTVPTTGNYYISFHCTSATDMWNLYIDDVLLTYPSTATCNICNSVCTAPGAPTLTTATGTCAGVTLNWTAGTGTTNSYNVYRKASPCGGTYTKVAGPLTSVLTYNDTSAAGGTAYAYVVRGACDAGGVTESGNSNCLTATRLVTPTPTITGGTANVCPAVTVLLSTESGQSGYQWYIGGSPIGGANAYQYTVTASGSYTVSYSNGSCTGTSSPQVVTISACAPNIVYSTHGTLTQVTGNGDAYYDLGEKWSVSVTLANSGNLAATNVNATFGGNGITVCTPTQSFGTIGVGGTGSATFEFVISTTFTPCGGSINFNVTNKTCTELTPAGADQNGVFSIVVGQPGAGTVTLFGPDDAPATSGLWTLTGYTTNTGNTCSGHTTALIRSTNAAGTYYATQITPVSTVGYTTITVGMDWRVTAATATLYLDWSTNGSTWNLGAASTNSTTMACLATQILPAGAEGQATLYIRFRTVATAASRGLVDYMSITGYSGSNCSYVGTGTCGCAVPAAPTAVTATAGCTGNSVAWTNAPTATSHNVLRGTTCGTVLNTFTNVTTPYNDTSAVAGTAYQYWVVGLNACGTSANSTCSAATRLAVPAAPSAPTVTDINACLMNGVQVTWGAVSGATSYDLRYNGATIVVGVTSPYTYSPGDTSAHNYEIRALNACGAGSWSVPTSGTDANGTPTASVITAVNDINPSLLTGVSVVFTSGSGTQRDLWVDGTQVATAITSPYTYTPGDSLSHNYVVRDINGTCYADSNTMAGVDAVTGCTAPATEVIETVTTSAINWSSIGSDNYRVVRGLQSNLVALNSSAQDFSCIQKGAALTYTHTTDDPSLVVGRCYYYLIQGYNGTDSATITCMGPAGSATAGARQVEPATVCP